jgi:ATP-binding cassette, subfamily B, bacterial HlyB/CyaB
MDAVPPAGGKTDSGLVCLTLLLRFYGIGADGEQILHQLGTRTIGKTEMLRVARQNSLRAKVLSTTFDRLANTPLPAIAVLKDGGFVVVAKADDRKILLRATNQPRPSLLPREQARRCGTASWC